MRSHLTWRCAAAALIMLLLTFLLTAACASYLKPCFADCTSPDPARFVPDPGAAATVVAFQPTAPWMDTGLTVHKGDLFLVSATGEVFWQARNQKTGGDGLGGTPGWNVGTGGLQGKVGADGKAFDLGARTSLFPDKHARPPHHPHPPPPIAMPSDGALYLGFKAFTAGANTGALEVTIRPAMRATR
jgi:hypothetical protein